MADREVQPFEPRVSDWDSHQELLAASFEMLGQIAQILVAANGGSPGKVQRWPRPETAVQRARVARLHRTHDSLVERLTPK